MNRGAARRDVFVADGDRVEFGRLVAEACERTAVRVRAYCLMGNHFHLVLDCPDGGLSAFMQHVTGVWTRHMNERRGTDGSLFRGRYCSRRIDSMEYLVAAVRYVHRNPLAFLNEADLADYRWSSHRAYLGLRRAPPWLVVEDVVAWLGGTEGYASFVTDSPAGELDGVDADALIAAVDQVAAEYADDLDRSRRGLARTATALVLPRLSPTVAAAVADRLKYSSDDARRQALARANRAAGDEPRLHEVAGRAAQLLGVHFVSDTK